MKRKSGPWLLTMLIGSLTIPTFAGAAPEKLSRDLDNDRTRHVDGRWVPDQLLWHGATTLWRPGGIWGEVTSWVHDPFRNTTALWTDNRSWTDTALWTDDTMRSGSRAWERTDPWTDRGTSQRRAAWTVDELWNATALWTDRTFRNVTALWTD